MHRRNSREAAVHRKPISKAETPQECNAAIIPAVYKANTIKCSDTKNSGLGENEHTSKKEGKYLPLLK